YIPTDEITGPIHTVDINGQVGRVKGIVNIAKTFFINAENGYFAFIPGEKINLDLPQIDKEMYEKKASVAATQDMKERSTHYPQYVADSIVYKLRKLAVTPDYQLMIGTYVLRTVISKRVDSGRLEQYRHSMPIGSCEAKHAGVEHVLPNKAIDFHRWVWEDGSEAFIDRRGILHLKSSDTSLPEISILLLNTIETAMWSSDGIVAGNPKFIIPGNNVRTTDFFFHQYIKPFIDRILKK
ncbi:MAG TPA: hypothetical protein VHM26_15955, partial [Chitinophagaceae bacterium]|nr:hypothetical protein [Chitinophagaceae bacterium]